MKSLQNKLGILNKEMGDMTVENKKLKTLKSQCDDEKNILHEKALHKQVRTKPVTINAETSGGSTSVKFHDSMIILCFLVFSYTLYF